MFEFSDGVSEYFDPAYMATAEGLRELQSIYDYCPVGIYPDINSPGCEILRLNPLIDKLPACQRLESYIKGIYTIQLYGMLKKTLWDGKAGLPCNRITGVTEVSVDRIYSSRGLDPRSSVRTPWRAGLPWSFTRTARSHSFLGWRRRSES